MRRICIVGGGARELAIARSVKGSPLCGALVCIAPAKNPAIAEICDEYKIGKADSPDDVVAFCKETKVDIAFIGPEAPLAAGVVDALEAAGIGAVGPTKALSKVESSKEYCRQVCGLSSTSQSPPCSSPETRAMPCINPLLKSLNFPLGGLRGRDLHAQ
jgi:phosphoribosylamine--glycine ligase